MNHAHDERNRQQRVGSRSHQRDVFRFRNFICARLDHAEDLFLIRPDEYPNVERHDRAQPRADAYRHCVRVAALRIHSEHEGIVEHAAMRQKCGTRQPGNNSTPTEPGKCARRDVLRDARSARTAFVSGRLAQRGDLHEIEVIKQPDPYDAGKHMQPDDYRIDLHCADHVVAHRHEHDDDGEHEAAHNRTDD